MTQSSASSLLPVRRQIIAGSIYLVIVAALLASSLSFLSDLMARSEAVASAEKGLDQLAKRGQRRADAAASAAGMAGYHFLDGPTNAIAGNALEPRVSEAIGKAGGAITSAQVEFDGPDAKNGFVELMTSAEVNQSALQAILYDIEAGLPYLFIEKLSLQSPEDFGEPETGRMRITIAVAGQWRASKSADCPWPSCLPPLSGRLPARMSLAAALRLRSKPPMPMTAQPASPVPLLGPFSRPTAKGQVTEATHCGRCRSAL